VPSEGVRNSAL